MTLEQQATVNLMNKILVTVLKKIEKNDINPNYEGFANYTKKPPLCDWRLTFDESKALDEYFLNLEVDKPTKFIRNYGIANVWIVNKFL